jgi:hypothetical protein
VLESEKIQPLFKNHSHFILDFEYFYGMGKQLTKSPRQLYSDPGNNGTPVLLLHKNVFHPYPPPAALLFRLFSFLPFAYSYALWSFSVYVLIICSFFLLLKCLNTEPKNGASGMWFPLILCISAAPSFLDSSFGNVNSLLLLLCIVYGWSFNNKKYVSAGVTLSVAFWLKLYPALLLIMLFRTNEKWKLAGSFIIGATFILVISLFFIPLEVFKEFFSDIAPAYSKQTTTHIFNQSLAPALIRIVSPIDSAFNYNYILIPQGIRIAVYVIILSAIVLFCLLAWKYKTSDIYTIAGLCNFIPLITPIGWGYTFVMLYPSMILLYYKNISKKKISFVLYLLCWFALATPSYHRIEQFHVPDILKLVYYSRYTIAAIVLCFLLFQQMIISRSKELSVIKA